MKKRIVVQAKRTLFVWMGLVALTLSSQGLSQDLREEAQALESDVLSFAEATVSERFPKAQVAVTMAPLNLALFNHEAQESCQNYQLIAPEHINPGSLSIKVRCKDWAFYARVDAKIKVRALTTTHLVERGKLIAKTDLLPAWIELKHVSQSYINDQSDAIGRIAHRTIRAGQPLRAQALRTPYAVNKGDRVVIQATMGAARITTTGEALQNGHIGQQIPVRNIRSERVVRPWIIAKGTVSTRPIGT